MRNLHRGQQNPSCAARPGLWGMCVPTAPGMGRPHHEAPGYSPLCSPRSSAATPGQSSAWTTASCLHPLATSAQALRGVFLSSALTCRTESSVPMQWSFAQTSPVFRQALGSCPSLLAGRAQPCKGRRYVCPCFCCRINVCRGEDGLFRAGGLHQPGSGEHKHSTIPKPSKQSKQAQHQPLQTSCKTAGNITGKFIRILISCEN